MTRRSRGWANAPDGNQMPTARAQKRKRKCYIRLMSGNERSPALSRFFDTRPLIFCNSEKVIRSQLALPHTPGGRWHTNMLRLSFMRISSPAPAESHPPGYPPPVPLSGFFSAPHAHMRKMSAKRPQTKLLRALYKHLSSLDGLCIFNLFGLPGRFKRCSDIRSLEHLRYLKAPLPPIIHNL